MTTARHTHKTATSWHITQHSRFPKTTTRRWDRRDAWRMTSPICWRNIWDRPRWKCFRIGKQFHFWTIFVWNSTSLWGVTPCKLTEVYWHFGGTYWLYLQGRRVTREVGRAIGQAVSR
jgi:hypothetical protein